MKKLFLAIAILLGGLSVQTMVSTPAQAAPVMEAKRSDCNKYVGLFKKYGLPVSTFKAIAWRESGCNHRSFVIDHDDAGGGLLGINLKGKLARMWYKLCGATLSNIRNAEVNVRCAAKVYRTMGLRPWGGRPR